MPTLRGSATTSSGTLGTGRAITRPTGLASDDVVLIAVQTEAAFDPELAVSGFTEILYADAGTNGGGPCHLTVLAATGFSGAGSFTITSTALGSSDYLAAICVAYSDADATLAVGTPFADTPGGGSATISIPSVTSTEDGAQIAAFAAQRFANASAWTWDAAVDVLTSIDGIGSADRSQTTAGAAGAIDVTTGSAFQPVAAVQVAIHPPASAVDTILAGVYRERSYVSTYREVGYSGTFKERAHATTYRQGS